MFLHICQHCTSVYATNNSYDAYTVASKQLVGLVLLCIFDIFRFPFQDFSLIIQLNQLFQDDAAKVPSETKH